jgi:hypothetical protein
LYNEFTGTIGDLEKYLATVYLEKGENSILIEERISLRLKRAKSYRRRCAGQPPLGLTGLSRGKFEPGFDIAVCLLARLVLQVGPAAQLLSSLRGGNSTKGAESCLSYQLLK